MRALSLRGVKLRQICGGVAHACVQLCLAVVWVSQLDVCGGVVNASCCDEICFKCKLLMR